MKLLKDHHVKQISEQLGSLYNGKASLRDIRKVQQSTWTRFGADTSYFPLTSGECNLWKRFYLHTSTVLSSICACVKIIN